MADALFSHLIVVIVAACFGGLIAWIAYMEGYFKLPPNPISEQKISFGYIIEAFGLFLVMELLVAPSFYLLWLSWEHGHLVKPGEEHVSPLVQGWVNLAAIAGTGLALAIFYRSLNSEVKREVWGPQLSGGSFSHVMSNWLFGACSWFIAYPWVLAGSQAIAIVLLLNNATPKVDQVAVKHVKEAVADPLLLSIMVVAIVIVVPIIEELLFRGFLQTWLKKVIGMGLAIIIVSCIFTLFHFSTSQGAENYELLPSLFVLSCFLGFVRERKQSLWASIGLHSTFNLISIALILNTGK